MQPHQQRVVDEKTELDSKIEKLEAFFSNPIFESIDKAEQKRLYKQSAFMRLYSETLEERIANF